jgi:hypothetical protein
VLMPLDRTSASRHKAIPVAIRKIEEKSDQSDLMQRWEKGPDYIFLESPDEQEEFATYLKDREAEGVKSVHFYFPNDLEEGMQATNHIIIEVFRIFGWSCCFHPPMRRVAVKRPCLLTCQE